MPKVKTASGDVTIETAEQELEVKTASGDVKVAVLRGAGGVNTMSGDVTVGDASAALPVNTMSGDVNVKRLASASVQLRSMSGDLRAGIARGATLWVDANSASGDVRSELLELFTFVRAQRPDRPGQAGLGDPVPERALVDPEVTLDLSDRLLGLLHDPDSPLTELPVELPALLWHDYSS